MENYKLIPMEYIGEPFDKTQKIPCCNQCKFFKTCYYWTGGLGVNGSIGVSKTQGVGSNPTVPVQRGVAQFG